MNPNAIRDLAQIDAIILNITRAQKQPRRKIRTIPIERVINLDTGEVIELKKLER